MSRRWRAYLPADLLVRLAKRRRLYRAATPYAGRSRPSKHGAQFRLHETTIQANPDHTITAKDLPAGMSRSMPGRVCPTKGRPPDAFRVVRVLVEHLPHHAGAPGSLRRLPSSGAGTNEGTLGKAEQRDLAEFAMESAVLESVDVLERGLFPVHEPAPRTAVPDQFGLVAGVPNAIGPRPRAFAVRRRARSGA